MASGIRNINISTDVADWLSTQCLLEINKLERQLKESRTIMPNGPDATHNWLARLTKASKDLRNPK